MGDIRKGVANTLKPAKNTVYKKKTLRSRISFWVESPTDHATANKK
jgi:hypothetical protein